MRVACPHCGKEIVIRGLLGRRPKNIAVKIVLDKLQATRNVEQAAGELGCSRGYIYNRLKAAGLSLQQVLESNEKTPDSKL